METDQVSSASDPKISSKPMDGNQVQLVASCSMPASGSAPVGVAVPLLHRVQVSPVLVPSVSSAFQVAAPASSACASGLSSGAGNVHAVVHGGETKPLQGNTVFVHQQPLTAVGHVACSSTETEVSSPAPVAANTAVTTLPPASFYFMVPNNATAVPAIAPRPPTSEGLTSPPMMTNTARCDAGSPVTAVPTSPLEVDVSPSALPPLKRQHSGSPRESKRRAIHNEVERRRRDKINYYMEKLKEMVPNPPAGASNNSKGHVLEKAVMHITELQNQLSAVQRRYDIEHSQLLQCASEHTLLRQELLNRALKPPFGLFKIAPPTNGVPYGESKAIELIKVSMQNVVPTHTSAYIPATVATVKPGSFPAAAEQSSTPISILPPVIVPDSPPPLTVVTLPPPGNAEGLDRHS